MGTKVGGVGTSGDTLTYFKTPVSIGIQLDPGEYPSGTFTMPHMTAGGARWRNGNYGQTLAIWLCLCDSAGNNKVRIGTFNVGANSTSFQNTWTVTGAEALAGKALYLIMEDSIAGDGWDTRDYTALQSWTGISCETAQNNFSIGMLGGTGGSIACNKYSAAPGETITVTCTPESGWSASAPSSSPAVTMTAAGANKWTFVMPSSDITLTPNFSKINYTVSKVASPAAGGTVSLSKTTANIGDVITVTASPATGYRATGITTSPSLTVSNNKFTMPAGNVTVTVTFEKITYSIGKSVSPSAGGTVNLSRATATYGDSVTVTQTPNAGYYFNGWTKTPSNLSINSSGQFTMPAQNVSLVANYLLRSTARLDSTTLEGNTTVKLTIIPDKSTYKHKYKLNFGTNMATGWVDVEANVREVNISIPDNWAQQIPNSATKTGGTLTVETYNGSTKIGEYVISNLTYKVRESAKPSLSDITKSIARQIPPNTGTIYANIGDYYVQNKCGVAISATAGGVLSSTITSIACTLSGYSGRSYNKTVTNTTSLSYTTGLLTIAGEITITVTATDSRGRTTTKTTKITVSQYNAPSGTLSAERVNAQGTTDVLGEYAKYTQSNSYTAIGQNALTVKLKVNTGTAVTINRTAYNDFIMPGSPQQFSQINEYTITLILQDAFETVNIVTKLPTAQFLIGLGADGTRMAFMKAVNESLSKNGKDGVLEISSLAQVYIGTETLEAYIRRIANS